MLQGDSNPDPQNQLELKVNASIPSLSLLTVFKDDFFRYFYYYFFNCRVESKPDVKLTINPLILFQAWSMPENV